MEKDTFSQRFRLQLWVDLLFNRTEILINEMYIYLDPGGQFMNKWFFRNRFFLKYLHQLYVSKYHWYTWKIHCFFKGKICIRKFDFPIKSGRDFEMWLGSLPGRFAGGNNLVAHISLLWTALTDEFFFFHFCLILLRCCFRFSKYGFHFLMSAFFLKKKKTIYRYLFMLSSFILTTHMHSGRGAKLGSWYLMYIC